MNTTSDRDTGGSDELVKLQEEWVNNGARKERRDAVMHRQRIIAAARDLFAARGVDATSMHEIARAAGVGQGTLYRRYAHKGELCGDLLADSMRRFCEDVGTHLLGAGAGESALARLDGVLTRLVTFNEANGPLLGAIGDAACGERRAGPYHSPFYRWLRQTVSTLLQEAVACAEAAPLDVEATVDAVLALLAIDVYLYQRHALDHTPERITAALRRLLFEGLRGRPANAAT